jgi:hypothetical protein
MAATWRRATGGGWWERGTVGVGVDGMEFVWCQTMKKGSNENGKSEVVFGCSKRHQLIHEELKTTKISRIQIYLFIYTIKPLHCTGSSTCPRHPFFMGV